MRRVHASSFPPCIMQMAHYSRLDACSCRAVRGVGGRGRVILLCSWLRKLLKDYNVCVYVWTHVRACMCACVCVFTGARVMDRDPQHVTIVVLIYFCIDACIYGKTRAHRFPCNMILFGFNERSKFSRVGVLEHVISTNMRWAAWMEILWHGLGWLFEQIFPTAALLSLNLLWRQHSPVNPL